MSNAQFLVEETWHGLSSIFYVGLMFLDCSITAVGDDEQKRQHIRARIKSYMDRAEEIKRIIQKEKDGEFSWTSDPSETNCESSIDTRSSRFSFFQRELSANDSASPKALVITGMKS